MENKMQKFIIVTPEGEHKEIEGEGVVCVALTSEGGRINVKGGVFGSFSPDKVAALIQTLENNMGVLWIQGMMLINMVRTKEITNELKERAEEKEEASQPDSEEPQSEAE